jgi:hypothetical protein
MFSRPFRSACGLRGWSDVITISGSTSEILLSLPLASGDVDHGSCDDDVAKDLEPFAAPANNEIGAVIFNCA